MVVETEPLAVATLPVLTFTPAIGSPVTLSLTTPTTVVVAVASAKVVARVAGLETGEAIPAELYATT